MKHTEIISKTLIQRCKTSYGTYLPNRNFLSAIYDVEASEADHFFRLFTRLQMNQCRTYGLFVSFLHESNVQFVLFSLYFDIFCVFSFTPLISPILLSEFALERFAEQLYTLHVHDRDERMSLMSLESTLQHLCIKAHTQDSRH